MEKRDVEKAQGGDMKAFERLVKRHEKQVYSVALRMTGNESDAFDLSQETFIRMFQSIKSFKGDCAFSTWLHRIATNICLDFLRKQKRRFANEEAWEIESEEKTASREVPDLRYSPETAMEKRQVQEAVQAALLTLSPEHRQVLLLREISGLSYAEISETLDMEVGTVKSRIARAREQLRIKLTESGNFPGAGSV